MASRKSKKSKSKSPAAKPYKFEVSRQSGRKASDRAAAKNSAAAPFIPSDAAERQKIREQQSASNYIPPEVSQRMVRRVGLLAGVPTALGIAVFFINYFLLVKNILVLPVWTTMAETLALFGLGFVGISYGVLSASWEPEEPGSWLGLREFRFNAAALFQQWREFRSSK